MFKKKAKKKRSGPRRHWLSVGMERTAVILLLSMVVLGIAVVITTLILALRGDQAAANANELAFRGFMASVFLTGITTIYCGLTGFILLESRRMRLQAVLPHVQVSAPVRSPDAILVEVQNAGAAPAVDVEIRAWVMKAVGGTRTPEPAAVFIGTRPALPASAEPQRLKLVRTEQASFATWEEHLARAGIAADALDVYLLLVGIAYRAVDGTEMSECMALSLVEQEPLPGGKQ